MGVSKTRERTRSPSSGRRFSRYSPIVALAFVAIAFTACSLLQRTQEPLERPVPSECRGKARRTLSLGEIHELSGRLSRREPICLADLHSLSDASSERPVFNDNRARIVAAVKALAVYHYNNSDWLNLSVMLQFHRRGEYVADALKDIILRGGDISPLIPRLLRLVQTDHDLTRVSNAREVLVSYYLKTNQQDKLLDLVCEEHMDTQIDAIRALALHYIRTEQSDELFALRSRSCDPTPTGDPKMSIFVLAVDDALVEAGIR